MFLLLHFNADPDALFDLWLNRNELPLAAVLLSYGAQRRCFLDGFLHAIDCPLCRLTNNPVTRLHNLLFKQLADICPVDESSPFLRSLCLLVEYEAMAAALYPEIDGSRFDHHDRREKAIILPDLLF